MLKEFEDVFRSAVPETKRRLQMYLQGKVPDLPDLHDDLLADALGDTYESLLRAYRDLLNDCNEQTAIDEIRRRVLPLALVILRRRIADMFRSLTIRSSAASALEQPQDQIERESGPGRKVDLDSVTALVMRAIAELDDHDRDLMMLVYRESGARGLKLSASERKRLSRIRARLRDFIREETGTEITSWLQ